MTARLRRLNRGDRMRLDEFLDLHARLVTDEARAIDDPHERRCKEGEPPNGKERRNTKKADQRPKKTSVDGVRWLADHRRWEDAREVFIRQGVPIDAVLREWSSASAEYARLQSRLVQRVVELTSEGAAIVMLVDHLTQLERDHPDTRIAQDARMAAKFTIKRAGGLWADALKVVDAKAWT